MFPSWFSVTGDQTKIIVSLVMDGQPTHIPGTITGCNDTKTATAASTSSTRAAGGLLGFPVFLIW